MDVHSHVIEDPAQLNKLETIKTKTIFLMSTCKNEWELVKNFKYPLLPCFGIHPWFVEKHNEQDLDILTELLIQYPESIVGEIGLDKVAKSPQGQVYDFTTQQLFFEKQMKIAATLSRPVSIHSVQTHGFMLDYFRNLDKTFRQNKKNKIPELVCPPTIMMHSFSGPTEIQKALARLPGIGTRFYYSFSSIVNSRSPKIIEKIKEIPDDRILIESDVHSVVDVDEALDSIIDLVCISKNWSREYTIQRTIQNTLRYLVRL